MVYVMPTFALFALYMTLLNEKLGEGLGTRPGKGEVGRCYLRVTAHGRWLLSARCGQVRELKDHLKKLWLKFPMLALSRS